MESRHLLAWNVRKLRVARGISQEALALEAGIERAYLSRIENGEENASLKFVDKLAQALNVPVAKFFSVPVASEKKPVKLRGGPKPSKTKSPTKSGSRSATR